MKRFIMKRFILSAALGSAVAAASLSAMVPEQVTIDTGALAGTTGTVKPNVRIFKGIPFAAPPLGDLRWKAPQPAAKWEGVFKADAFGPSCTAGGGGGGRGRGAAPGAPGAAAPQAPAQPAAPPRQPPASEDCLTVNVWTSANSASDRRPVMVWIYGGGFTGGSGGMQWYDGEDLAAKGPVIVTLNYRLGALGFFAHPELAREAGHSGSGNYGMMDSLEALRWVTAPSWSARR
jgi:para-nitrobenzyl esterase